MNNTVRLKSLDEVESIEDLPKIDLAEGGDFSITLNINGIDIVQDCGIGSEETMKILKLLGYGNIGWERYNVINTRLKEPDIRKIGVLNSDGTVYATLPRTFVEKGDVVEVVEVNDKEIRLIKR